MGKKIHHLFGTGWMFRPREFVCVHSPPWVKAMFKNNHKFIFFKYYYKDSKSHWILEMNTETGSSLSGRADATWRIKVR